MPELPAELISPEVACRRKILRSTFFHTSKSHSAAPGMHAYCALRAKNARGYFCFAAVYFAFCFMVVKPSQSKQVEVSLASYLCLHHTRLYYFSTYFTHENSKMAFMATL